MTRLEAPTFDGKAKSYLRFKQRFEELVVTQFDAMAQLEFLEKGLPQKVKDKLTLVHKTPQQVWDQLDILYADPKVVLRESVAELHGLNAKKLGDEYMVRFATTLEDTEALLERDGNADYLRHPREVTALQDMLPKNERAEFVKRCRSYIGTDYVKFKTFLMERKAEQQDLVKFGGQETEG